MTESTGLLLHQLLRAHFNACHTAMGERGLQDIGSPRLLFTLSQYPQDPQQAPTQKDLAQRLHIAPATVATSLKSLERCGYVTRRTDEQDSRRNRIFITPKGLDALSAGRQALEAVDEHMYSGFSPQERELILNLHRRMLDNLYQIGGNISCPPPERLV